MAVAQAESPNDTRPQVEEVFSSDNASPVDQKQKEGQEKNEGDTKDRINKQERKSRKELLKFGAERVPGVTKVVIKGAGQGCWSIKDPEVYEQTGGGFHLVFGPIDAEGNAGMEALTEELEMWKQLKATLGTEGADGKSGGAVDAKGAGAQDKQNASPKKPSDADAEGKGIEGAETAKSGEAIAEQDIALVMDQTKCSREQAVAALTDTADVVEAILKIYNN